MILDRMESGGVGQGHGGREIGWRDADEEWMEHASLAAMGVA